jgi:hypothetical protein
MQQSNGEIATSDAENADMISTHFKKVVNNYREIDPTVLDKIKQREVKRDLGDLQQSKRSS